MASQQWCDDCGALGVYGQHCDRCGCLVGVGYTSMRGAPAPAGLEPRQGRVLTPKPGYEGNNIAAALQGGRWPFNEPPLAPAAPVPPPPRQAPAVPQQQRMSGRQALVMAEGRFLDPWQ